MAQQALVVLLFISSCFLTDFVRSFQPLTTTTTTPPYQKTTHPTIGRETTPTTPAVFRNTSTFPAAQFFGLSSNNPSDERSLDQYLCHAPSSPNKCCNCQGDCWKDRSCCIDVLWNDDEKLNLDQYLKKFHDKVDQYIIKTCEPVFSPAKRLRRISDKLFMITSCPLSARKLDRQYCLADSSQSDIPQLYVPVRDQSDLLYKNMFCARCNSVNKYSFIDLILSCEAKKQRQRGETATKVLESIQPFNCVYKAMDIHTRTCTTNRPKDNDCSPTNENYDFCQVYNAPVHGYKNPHCWKCLNNNTKIENGHIFHNCGVGTTTTTTTTTTPTTTTTTTTTSTKTTATTATTASSTSTSTLPNILTPKTMILTAEPPSPPTTEPQSPPTITLTTTGPIRTDTTLDPLQPFFMVIRFSENDGYTSFELGRRSYGILCKDGERFDTINGKCVPVVCPYGFEVSGKTGQDCKEIIKKIQKPAFSLNGTLSECILSQNSSLYVTLPTASIPHQFWSIFSQTLIFEEFLIDDNTTTYKIDSISVAEFANLTTELLLRYYGMIS